MHHFHMTDMSVKLLSCLVVLEAFSLARKEFMQSGTYASRIRYWLFLVGHPHSLLNPQINFQLVYLGFG